jgi:D-alanyl-lipoteichoic acid acyltransferase DltB (MBOAT superfamily)
MGAPSASDWHGICVQQRRVDDEGGLSLLFNSLAFLVFAPLVLALYFVSRGRARLVILVFASYFFYGWWDWRFTSLLLLSTTIDYGLGLIMGGETRPRRRRALLTLSLVSNLGILGVFKYFDFFSDSFRELAQAIGWSVSTPVLNVILPVGISFYTFQTLSYTIDLYRGRIPAERDFLRFAAYVALFPQLVAGPIVRASQLLPQLRFDQRIDASRISRGIELILWGFFLKLCLADTAAIVVDHRFGMPDDFGALSHAIGVLAFALQIYGDFAGYSLIAIGLGRIMGLDFGINFNRPYFSQSFSEFWERWHISLSSWLRDYLYIPLGGNRGGRLFTFRNLVITMALGGLWHGAGVTFIIWGLLHGLYLVLQRVFSRPYWLLVEKLHVPRLAAGGLLILVVFLLTNIAWVFFRAESLEDAVTILTTIAGLQDLSVGAGDQRIPILKTALVGAVVIAVDAASMNPRIQQAYMRNHMMRIGGSAAVLWLILLLGTFQGTSFIYFQF